MTKIRIMPAVLLAAAIILQLGFPYIPRLQCAFAEDSWKSEFESICSKTDDAMSLSKEELKTLIDRCDKLKPLIEKLDETQSKVYLKRLKMCRELFVFVLESKEK